MSSRYHHNPRPADNITSRKPETERCRGVDTDPVAPPFRWGQAGQPAHHVPILAAEKATGGATGHGTC